MLYAPADWTQAGSSRVACEPIPHRPASQCIVLSSGSLACFAGRPLLKGSAPACVTLTRPLPPLTTALLHYCTAIHGSLPTARPTPPPPQPPHHPFTTSPISLHNHRTALLPCTTHHTTATAHTTPHLPLSTATGAISAISTAPPHSVIAITDSTPHRSTAATMRRSASISSVSSQGSDADETMHIFIKTVSGDSSKPHLGTPIPNSEPQD